MSSMALVPATASAKARSKPDPTTSANEILECLEAYMSEMGSRHIHKLLSPPPGVHWKSACPINWLSKLGSFYSTLLEKAPGGVLAKRKVKLALELLHGKQPINFTQREDEVILDQANEHIRMGLAHLRQLKLDKALLERAARKASEADMVVIFKLMEKMQLSPGEVVRQDSFGSSAAGGCEGSPPPAASSVPPSTSGGAVQADEVMDHAESHPCNKTPEQIFQGILEQEDSEESSAEAMPGPDHQDEEDDRSSNTSQFVVPGLKILLKEKDDDRQGDDPLVTPKKKPPTAKQAGIQVFSL